jgi:chaperonin GroEL (HSP60 family)
LALSLSVVDGVPDSVKLLDLVGTCIGTKAQAGSVSLVGAIVEAVTKVFLSTGKVSTSDICVVKRVGGGVDDSVFVNGVVFDGVRSDLRMPSRVVADDSSSGVSVLCINAPIEVTKTETDAKININDPSMIQAFLDQEAGMVEKLAGKVLSSGARVVFCLRSVDELAQSIFTRKGVLVFKNLPSHVVNAIAKFSGAKVVSSIDDISVNDLGQVSCVEERTVDEVPTVFVTSSDKGSKPFTTLLIRGGTEHVVDEVERSVMDAVGVLKSVLEDRTFVPGGGATEMALSKDLYTYANTLKGKEQLAVKAFAEALESIPMALAENAGLDPVDVMVALRAAHEVVGSASLGINVFSGQVEDMLVNRVIEPARVKIQALLSAAEVAVMLLRIDDVIAAAKLETGLPPSNQ